MNFIKHISILGTLALLATGCSQEGNVSVDSANDYVEVPITLSLSVKSGLNMANPASRTDYDSELNTAPRRLILWHAEQSINDMRVYVFKSDTEDGDYVYAGGGECSDGAYKIAEFCNNTPWCPVLQPDDPYETHVLTFKPALKKGSYYKFLAVGRDDGKCQTASLDKSFIDWGSTKVYTDIKVVPGVTHMTDVKVSNILETRHYPYVSTELFSGVMTYTNPEGKEVEDVVYVDDNTLGFQKHIILHRAVAGLWVYITDIPAKAIDNTGGPYNGRQFNPMDMAVFMPKAASEINLYSYDGKDVSTLENIPVGYVDFKNIYPQSMETYWNTDGDYWHHKQRDNYFGMTIARDCALMSNFLLPLDLSVLDDMSQSTLTLRLRENEGPRSEFICKIKCHIECVTDAKTGETKPYEGDPTHFPIIANCIYVLGSPEHPFSLSTVNTQPSSRSADVPTIEMGVTVIQ